MVSMAITVEKWNAAVDVAQAAQATRTDRKKKDKIAIAGNDIRFFYQYLRSVKNDTT